MTQPSPEPDFDNDLERISPALGEDLRALLGPGELKVPPTVNARILNDARAQLARSARGSRQIGSMRRALRWAGAAAAAAVLVLAIRFTLLAPQAEVMHATSVPAAADVNRDGRIDILDALALARSIEHNGSPAHDITGDGVVDQRDVDAVAMMAISLDQGGVR